MAGMAYCAASATSLSRRLARNGSADANRIWAPAFAALDFQAVFFCELDDGLLRRARAFFDVYDVGVQLGVLPARGSLSAKALLALRGYGLRSRAEPAD